MFEYCSLLEIDSLKKVLGNNPNLNLEGLFYNNNQCAFQIALHKTLQYNNEIIKRSRVHTELLFKAKVANSSKIIEIENEGKKEKLELPKLVTILKLVPTKRTRC